MRLKPASAAVRLVFCHDKAFALRAIRNGINLPLDHPKQGFANQSAAPFGLISRYYLPPDLYELDLIFWAFLQRYLALGVPTARALAPRIVAKFV
jgi:hypothetical protein